VRDALPAGARALVDEVRGALAQEPPTTAAWPNRMARTHGGGSRNSRTGEGVPAESGAEAAVGRDRAGDARTTHDRDVEALAPWIEGLDDLRRGRPAEAQAATPWRGCSTLPRRCANCPLLRPRGGARAGPLDRDAGAQPPARPSTRRVSRRPSRDARALGASRRAMCSRASTTSSAPPRELFEGMDLRVSVRPPPPALLDRLRVADGSLDEGRLRSPRLARRGSPASSRSLASDVPAPHWFKLGRPMTPVESDIALVSWSVLDVRVPDAGLVMREP
jgi:hypothetical protein